jgi:hypothetical protein
MKDILAKLTAIQNKQTLTEGDVGTPRPANRTRPSTVDQHNKETAKKKAEPKGGKYTDKDPWTDPLGGWSGRTDRMAEDLSDTFNDEMNPRPQAQQTPYQKERTATSATPGSELGIKDFDVWCNKCKKLGFQLRKHSSGGVIARNPQSRLKTAQTVGAWDPNNHGGPEGAIFPDGIDGDIFNESTGECTPAQVLEQIKSANESLNHMGEDEVDEGASGTLMDRVGKFTLYRMGADATIYNGDSPVFTGSFQEAGDKFKQVKSKLSVQAQTRLAQFKEGDEQVNELSPDTMKSYVKKAVDPVNPKSISNLASRGAYELGYDHAKDGNNLSAGEKDDKKAFQRSKGVQRAVNKLTKEGLGDTIKKGVKQVKRGMQGWGAGNLPITGDANSPKDLVKRNKGYNTDTATLLRGNKPVDKTDHSPQGLQRRVLDRKLTKESQLDELSPNTLNSYSDKATHKLGQERSAKRDDAWYDRAGKDMKHVDGSSVATGRTPDEKNDANNKVARRLKGLSTAHKKLTKENTTMAKRYKVVTESHQSFSVDDPHLAKVLRHFGKEVSIFQQGGDLDDHLYNALYDFWFDEMPYGTKKARDGDPYEWISEKLDQELSNENFIEPSRKSSTWPDSIASEGALSENGPESDDWYDKNGYMNPNGAYDAAGHYFPERDADQREYDSELDFDRDLDRTNDPYDMDDPAPMEEAEFDEALNPAIQAQLAICKAKNAASPTTIGRNALGPQDSGTAFPKNPTGDTFTKHDRYADIHAKYVGEQGGLDEAFLVEENEGLITEILTDMGLDEGLDFFFDNGLVAIGRSTARVVINALKADPRIHGTPAIQSMDGEEVQITFNKQPSVKAPELKVDDIPAADFDPEGSISYAPMHEAVVKEDVTLNITADGEDVVDTLRRLSGLDSASSKPSFDMEPEADIMDVEPQEQPSMASLMGKMDSIGADNDEAPIEDPMGEPEVEIDENHWAMNHPEDSYDDQIDKWADEADFAHDQARDAGYEKEQDVLARKPHGDAALKQYGDDPMGEWHGKNMEEDISNDGSQTAQALIDTIKRGDVKEFGPQVTNQIKQVAKLFQAGDISGARKLQWSFGQDTSMLIDEIISDEGAYPANDISIDDKEIEEDKFANSVDEPEQPSVHTSTTDMLNRGEDLNRPKKQSYPLRPLGNNPMAEARKLMTQYSAMRDNIKAK